jgi:Fur family ferric uptake transcriptional regulator
MAPHLKSYADCLDYCRQQGMRLSKQRQQILNLLWTSQTHLSVRDIYNRLLTEGVAIGSTSIYQNLDVLSRAGIIERVERAEGCLYSYQTLPHSHVHCLDDGQILDIMVDLPPDLVANIEQQTGLTVMEYRVEFYARKKPDSEGGCRWSAGNLGSNPEG